MIADSMVSAVGMIGDVVSAVVILEFALTGTVNAGDATALLVASVALHQAVRNVSDQVSPSEEALRLFGSYLSFVDASNAERRRLAVRPSTLARGISFDDVWFRYSTEGPWVLKGVLTISARSTVALVGSNGAGKSTLIKLLLGMYEPTRGFIRWDGTDYRDLDLEQLRERMTAVFQDFMPYEFSACDNIAVGGLQHSNIGSVRNAAKTTGADALVSGFPNGYLTMLSTIFATNEDGSRGTTLSGGDWQRLALARTRMRKDVDVTVLGEPSSGLDAEGEADLVRALADSSVGARVLISHRLNTLRFADVIYVLDHGTIVEVGAHAELLALQGRYHKLFTAQARGYADEMKPAVGS